MNYFELLRSNFELIQMQVYPPKLNFQNKWVEPNPDPNLEKHFFNPSEPRFIKWNYKPIQILQKPWTSNAWTVFDPTHIMTNSDTPTMTKAKKCDKIFWLINTNITKLNYLFIPISDWQQWRYPFQFFWSFWSFWYLPIQQKYLLESLKKSLTKSGSLSNSNIRNPMMWLKMGSEWEFLWKTNIELPNITFCTTKTRHLTKWKWISMEICWNMSLQVKFFIKTNK